MSDKDLVVRSIKKRYITGLIIIGLSACASFVCLRLALMRSQSTALIVNLSGRQRMLSQHIALDALKVSKSYSQNSASLRKEALEDIAIHSSEMQLANKKLSSGDISNALNVSLSKPARKLYFGETNLSQRVNNYSDLGTQVASKRDRAKIESIIDDIIKTSPTLLKDLDRAVDFHQKEGEQKLAFAQWLEVGIIGLTLVLLLAEARLIFYPIIQLVIDSKKSETTRIDELTEQVELRTLKLEKSNLRLRELALIDQLTGLKNRSCLLDDISMLVNNFKKNQCHFGLAYIDIDWFKSVNDQFGHEFGDYILKEFANFVSISLRDSDSFYRIGGEEFVILFRRGEFEGIAKRLEAIRIDLEKHPFALGGNSHKITISAGLFYSSKYSEFDLSADDVLRLADNALYSSKANGRNKITVYSQSSN